jgi:hypothetical protein
MGTVEDFRNFINAVIDEASFDKRASYIDGARKMALPARWTSLSAMW